MKNTNNPMKEIKSLEAYLNSSDEQIHKEPTLTNVRIIADKFLEQKEFYKLEHKLKNEPLFAQLAFKLAKSKKIVNEIKEPVHISMIFAMYDEITRMKTPQENPLGEDFINVKVSQFKWLFENKGTWNIYLVDDGCPNGSGKAAEKIIKKNNYTSTNVLYLQNAIDKKLSIVKTLSSTNDSRKGGSIVYGLWQAAQKEKENHYVCYTDADLSTDLGQTGFLIDTLHNNHKLAAVGSRREEDSVVVKKGVRNTRGKLFIYLWKQMLHELDYIVDSQCAFKGFSSEIIPTITSNMIEPQFAFDLELLLKVQKYKQNEMEKIPVAWIDSEAASTTGDPYLNMIQSITKFYEVHASRTPEGDQFSSFIKQLNQNNWQKLVDNVPVEIAEKNPAEFSTYKGVSVKDFKDILAK